MKSILFKYTLNPLIFRANHAVHNYKDVVWLIGSPRSGTTWVSKLINHKKQYREVFEPFHPLLIDDMKFLSLNEYVGKEETYKALYEVSSRVFTGSFYPLRCDVGNASFKYSGLLIKDVFANLFSAWALNNFPFIKTVLLLRNPFAVALSTYKKKDWLWLTDPRELLAQANLYRDYLEPFEDIIISTSENNNYIVSQVLIWAINNYVVLKQFRENELHVCFYENIYRNPNKEITKLQGFINPLSTQTKTGISDTVITTPSHVIGSDSNLLSKTSPINSWKNEIPAKDIDAGLKILEYFGMDELYNENLNPNLHLIESFMDK